MTKQSNEMGTPSNVGQGQGQLSLYGYSVIDYARKYDPAFKKEINFLVNSLLKNPRCSKLLRHINTHDYDASFAARSSKFQMSTIPDESLRIVFSYLDDQSLLAAETVNTKWRNFASNDELWGNLLRIKFCVSSENILCQNQPLCGKDLIPYSKVVFFAMEEALRTQIYGGESPIYQYGGQRLQFPSVISRTALI